MAASRVCRWADNWASSRVERRADHWDSQRAEQRAVLKAHVWVDQKAYHWVEWMGGMLVDHWDSH